MTLKKILIVFIMFIVSINNTFADKPAPRPHKRHKKVTVVAPSHKDCRILVAPPKAILPPVAPLMPIAAPPILPPVVPSPARIPCKKDCSPESSTFIPNAHLAVGVGAQSPWITGLVGLRMEFPKVYLGVEPFISMPYGVGVDGLIYAYRGPVVQFYPLSVGFLVNWNYDQNGAIFGGSHTRFSSDQDINRLVDLRLGLGVQIKVACHIKLALDLRTSIPDPRILVEQNGICKECGTVGGVRLNASKAIGNAFAQTQLLVGVLF